MTNAAPPPHRAPGWLARWSLPLVLLAVLLDAGGWWLADALIHPQASFWERAMFRPGGDPVYFPYIRALAEGNLGEPVDLATRGQGPRAYPWLQLAPLALAQRLCGAAAFLLADLGFQVLRWWLIYRILRQLGVGRVAAQWSGAAISLLSAWFFLPFLAAGRPVYAIDRLPRPLTTDALTLGFLWAMLAALRSPAGRVPWKPLAVAGLLLGVAPHGDFHGAFSLGLMFGAGALWLAWRERASGLRGLAVIGACGLPALGLGGWWLAGSLSLPEEVTRRLGAFAWPRWQWPAPWEMFQPLVLNWFAGGLVVLLLALLARRRWGLGAAALPLGAVAVALLLTFAAPWVSLAAGGKMIQVYHFSQRLIALEYFTLCFLAAAWLRPYLEGRWIAAPMAVVALWMPFAGSEAPRAARNEIPFWAGALPLEQTRTHRYRLDFREVERTLARPEFASSRNLATLDPLVYSWWLSSSYRGAYLLDPFETVLPDRELEDRLLRVGNLCGAQNVLYIVNTVTLFYFHSTAKYQFGPGVRFDPATPLTPAEEKSLEGLHFAGTLNLIPPPREIIRMELRRRELAAQPQDYPFDLLILSRFYDGYLGEPDPRLFQKVLENPSFRVYRRAAP
jgi:hypothetical protein